MEEEKKDLSALPDALARRQRLISLANGESVVVEKFTVSKSLYVFGYLTELFKGLSKEELEKLQGDTYALAVKAIQMLGDKAPGLIKMCVRLADQGKVPADPDLDDAVEIIATAIELNSTEKLEKKAAELMERFRRWFRGNG